MNQLFFDQLPEKFIPFINSGKVADYIPALSLVSPDKFGIAASLAKGCLYQAGDSAESFSLQSISKVFALTMALRSIGDDFWSRINLKLSTRSFNAITPIEEANGTPRNPFTNGGAIAVVDQMLVHSKQYTSELLEFIHELTGNRSISYDLEMAASEKKTGFRNVAIAQFLKSYDVIKNDVEDVLDAYFMQCSLAMSCVDLSKAFLFLANNGFNPITGRQILTPLQCRRLNALLMMFGTYEAAGDFVFRIGLPGKSGVGGGISVIVPGKMSIAVWSPAIDEFGTSVAGLKALEFLTEEEGLSIL